MPKSGGDPSSEIRAALYLRVSTIDQTTVAGAGSCFGVTPSISRRPSGHTMCRSNTILTPKPPSDSEAFSVVGRTFPSNPANADEFSMASLVCTENSNTHVVMVKPAEDRI